MEFQHFSSDSTHISPNIGTLDMGYSACSDSFFPREHLEQEIKQIAADLSGEIAPYKVATGIEKWSDLYCGRAAQNSTENAPKSVIKKGHQKVLFVDYFSISRFTHYSQNAKNVS